MRFYLDTNILAFLYTENMDEFCVEVKELLSDYSNIFYASTECIHELIHLCQIDKLSFKKRRQEVNATEILCWLDSLGIEPKEVLRKHLQVYSELPLLSEHRDPCDRLIIAQAIADKIPIITSDRKFSWYEHYGLSVVFNKR